MFFELTELLSCPACGPEHRLVLLVREVEGRRVLGGWLGCANCQRDFSVSDGLADLRLKGEATEVANGDAPLDEDDLALKIAALSGLTEGPGYLMVAGSLAHVAADVAELLPGVEVIAFQKRPGDSAEREGVSRVISDVSFPFVPYRLRAVSITPRDDRDMVEAAARLVHAGGRLILFAAGPEAEEAAEAAGLMIVASKPGIAVAERRA